MRANPISQGSPRKVTGGAGPLLIVVVTCSMEKDVTVLTVDVLFGVRHLLYLYRLEGVDFDLPSLDDYPLSSAR